jgi:hypothetical protein
MAPSGPAAGQTRAIAVAALGTAAAALAVALFAAFAARPSLMASPPPSAPGAQPTAPLAMATCTGAVAESPDDEFWKIPLDQCDKAIDAIDVKSGFVRKWTICGGAKSFEVTLNPRAVVVSSDHVHCSSTPSEASVTFVGPLKK